MSSFKDFVEKQINIGTIIEILMLVIALVWFFAYIKSDVERNRLWNLRQDKEHHEFMREDVGNAQFEAIKSQLDRIEKKLD